MNYPETFKKKALELYPEPENAYLHRWISLGFNEAVGKVLDALAVGPIKTNKDFTVQEKLSRELDEKEKLYELWKVLVGKNK